MTELINLKKTNIETKNFSYNVFNSQFVSLFAPLKSKFNASLRKKGRENLNVLQQIIIDPYIRKLESCALKYRCVGEENFYLKRLGARQSRLISVLTFGNGGLAVRQSSCWLTSRWATHWAKWRSSFYHVEYVPPLLNIFAVKERLILNIFDCLRESVVLLVSHLLRSQSNEEGLTLETSAFESLYGG